MVNNLEAKKTRSGKIRASTLFKGVNVVIAISYKENNWDNLRSAASLLEAEGFVCYPQSSVSPSIRSEDNFVIMSNKPIVDKRENIQRAFFEKGIANARFLYVLPVRHDDKTYIGRTVAHEIAYAMLNNKPIIVSRPIQSFDATVPEGLVQIIKREMNNFLVVLPEDIKGQNRRCSPLRTLPETVNFGLPSEEKNYILGEIDVLLSDFAKGKH